MKKRNINFKDYKLSENKAIFSYQRINILTIKFETFMGCLWEFMTYEFLKNGTYIFRNLFDFNVFKKKKNASNLNELIKELKKSWIEQKSQN